uniref:Uncharacterized protein n=1 Tax=Trichogramma kaykai TaxID=54128 RepID=A0ABD2WXE7_9HYME
MRVHRQRCETEETLRAQLKRIPRFPTSLCTEQKLRCEPRESTLQSCANAFEIYSSKKEKNISYEFHRRLICKMSSPGRARCKKYSG